jgi:PKD repeat protein
VAKIDTDGNWIWAVKAGGDNISEYGNSIASDSNGNSYVTGNFRGSATFGSFLLSNYNLNSDDIFVAKLDTEGNWTWATQADGIDFGYGSSIAIDNNGNSYITSCLQYAAAFGSHPLIQNGVYNIFVAKLDADGNWVWASQADGINSYSGKSIATDNSGNSYLTGTLGSINSNFGSISLTSFGSWDIFVAIIDPNGYWLSATNAGGTNSDFGRTITIDNNGSSYVSGVFKSTANFGSNSLTSYGNTDIFVAKYNSLGTNFDADNTCGYFPLTVNFIDLSLNDPIEWEWDFNNDGTIDSYEQNPTYVFSQPGVYSVTLTVNDGTDIDTVVKNEYINVLESFTADFEAYPVSGESPHHVYFFDSSLINSLTWEWDFNNDGTIDSYEQNPTYTYNESGNYTVSLTTNDGINTNTVIKEAYISVSVVGIENNIVFSEIVSLSNHPNPFNPSTTIEFSIQSISKIDLSIYNIKGQKIKALTNNEYSKGNHSIIWNGVDELNKPVSSGVYYYKLEVNGKVEATKKCLLLK